MNNFSNTKFQQFNNLNFLRSVMIIMVVALHTDLFVGNYFILGHIPLHALIGFNLLGFAVPTFFLISIFLFSLKVNGHRQYFLKRLETLIYAYAFWVGLWIFISNKRGFEILKVIFNLPAKELIYFFSGDGIGIFYFHFSLILLTCFAFFAVKLNKYALYSLLIISMLLILIVPFTRFVRDPIFSEGWSPFAFIPYSFIGVLLSKENIIKISSKSFLITLFVSFLIFASGEWYCYLKNYCKLLPYMRISTVIGSSFIFISSFSIKTEIFKFLEPLSNYALGIYCLQYFVIYGYRDIFGSAPKGSIIFSASVLAISFIGTVFLRKAFSKKII